MTECHSDEILIEEVDFNIMEQFIEYVYTREIRIDENNVQSLIIRDSFLQMSSVQKACSDFLIGEIQPKNVLGIFKLADFISCKYLHSAAKNFILENFMKIINTDEFLSLEAFDIARIIESDG